MNMSWNEHWADINAQCKRGGGFRTKDIFLFHLVLYIKYYMNVVFMCLLFWRWLSAFALFPDILRSPRDSQLPWSGGTSSDKEFLLS